RRRLPPRPPHGLTNLAPTAALPAPAQPADERRPAHLLQVRQLLPRLAGRGPPRRGHVRLIARPHCPRPHRHLVLHLRGHQLHRRRLQPPHPRRARPVALHAVHPVLPPPGGRPHCPGPRLPTTGPPPQALVLAPPRPRRPARPPGPGQEARH